MGRGLEFLARIFSVLDHYDQQDDLYWCTGPRAGGGEYAQPATFFVKCSDVFYWGTADLEEITPENIGAFVSAYDDAAAAGQNGECSGGYLFVARLRGMRPQGASYPDEEFLWPLFDACGPPREVESGDPGKHPRDRSNKTPALHTENEMSEPMQATPQMAKMGLSFLSIESYAKEVLDLLKSPKGGDAIVAIADAGFRAFMALTTRDFPTLFAALNDANKNADSLIAAIKAEFGI